MNQLTQELKIKTAPLHEKLDQAPLLSKVMDPALSSETYAKIIQRMQECFSSVENAAVQVGGQKILSDWHYESRMPALKADLHHLGNLQSSSARSLPESPKSPASAIGMLYVLHGSCLGGQFIARKLAPQFPKDVLNFYGSSLGLAEGWKQFKEKADQCKDESAIADAVKGAEWAFSVFYEVFRE